jgi:integrase
VLKKDPDERSVDAVCAKRPKRLPTVMTREEVIAVITALSGTYQLIAKLLYGSA